MTAEITNGDVLCGRCGKTIPAFDVLYRVSVARLARCEPCAQTLGEPLPSPLTNVAPQCAPQPETFTVFDRYQAATTVRQNILDWRAKQSGERP